MDNNNLSDWLVKIESFNPNEIELGLSRIRQVAEEMQLLDFAGKVVLVGGTNGKGSCVATLEAIALQQNLNVGCYTSPHLINFNERVRINGEQVSDQLLVEAFNEVESVRKQVALTFFEFTTLVALWIFQQQELDLIVLEVGLGGRLDAVNIVEPNTSIVTTIDFDHSDWLGDSLQQIAREKAGIIRPGQTAFVGDEKSYQLLSKVEHINLASLQLISVDAVDEQMKADRSVIDDISLNPFQLLPQNILLAKQAFEFLFELPVKLTDVLPKIKIAGRCQLLDLPLPTIVDVAHNPQAAGNLVGQIKNRMMQTGAQKCFAICGMMADKAVEEVLSILDPVVDEWLFVDLPGERAIDAEALLNIYQQVNSAKPALSFASVKLAYDNLRIKATSQDMILVFGSFITVSNMLQYEIN